MFSGAFVGCGVAAVVSVTLCAAAIEWGSTDLRVEVPAKLVLVLACAGVALAFVRDQRRLTTDCRQAFYAGAAATLILAFGIALLVSTF